MEEKNNSTTEHKRAKHNNIFQKAVSNSLSIQSPSKTKKSAKCESDWREGSVLQKYKNGENFIVNEPQN